LKIVSTNIAKKEKITYKDKTWETGIFKKDTKNGIFLQKTGVLNDAVVNKKHHGGKNMAVYAFSSNNYAFFESSFKNISFYYGIFGENLTIQNFDEKNIYIGDVFKIGGAIIQVSQPRLPCKTLNAVFQSDDFMKLYLHTTFSGAYFRVLQEGQVSKNDTLSLLEQEKESLSLATVFSLFTIHKNNIPLIQKALEIKSLSDKLKKDIYRKLLK